MLEASAWATAIPSLWSAVSSWFTPAILFLLLNLMIATIALTSSLTPTNPPPSHHMNPNPHEQQQQQLEEHEEEGEGGAGGFTAAASTTKQSSSISILDRVKSLGLFSPRKSLQQRQPLPLITPEEFGGETGAGPMDPFEKQGLGQPGSLSPGGKFEAFDLYGYLPQEPASEIPRVSDPAHYIFEQTHPKEVLLPAERDEKIEEEEDEEAEEDEEDEDEDEEESRRDLPNLMLRRGIRGSESLNVNFRSSNLREEEGRGEEGLDEGDVVEEVDARADDFINRFRQQLKLQRMDLLVRQKDVMMMMMMMISKVKI